MTAGARQVSSQHQQSCTSTSMSANNNNNGHGGSGGSSSSNSSIDSHGHGGNGGSQSQSHTHSILFGQITRGMNHNHNHSHGHNHASSPPMSMSVLDSASNLNNIMGAGGGIKKTNNKPLMEKRRRARINKSLLELERLIILPNQDLKKGAAAKLEKADILEMTVKYLREVCEVQESQAHKWKAGFNECAKTVKHYLESNGHFNLSQQLTNHLLAVDAAPPPNLLMAFAPPDAGPDPPVQLELTINCSPASVSAVSDPEPEPVNLAKFKPSENDMMWRPWSLRPNARCYNGHGFDLSLSPHPLPQPHEHAHSQPHSPYPEPAPSHH